MSSNNTIITKEWSYEESIQTTKFLVQQFKKYSLEIVRELYIAREHLSAPGYRTDLKKIRTSGNIAVGIKQDFRTFKEYLDELELSERTARHWLALYSPKEDKLYTAEEMKLKLSALFEDVYQIRLTNPEYSPEDWSTKQESTYLSWEKKAHPNYIDSDFVEEEIAGFDREYLEILQRETINNPSVEDILHQQELCTKYKTTATPLVPISQQMHIVRFIEKSIEMFDSNKRAEITKSLSRVLALIALEMEE